jgi:quaternary ammonium compound-resistance protein SugE
MSWIYLFVAAIFEIGWPLGLKLSQVSKYRAMPILLAALAMALSGLFLWLAQKQIPIGTAYAVWTGIGAAGTFLIGMAFFGDAVTLGRTFGVSLIIAGVVTLKLSH